MVPSLAQRSYFVIIKSQGIQVPLPNLWGAVNCMWNSEWRRADMFLPGVLTALLLIDGSMRYKDNIEIECSKFYTRVGSFT
jgi:hypothetical protein